MVFKEEKIPKNHRERIYFLKKYENKEMIKTYDHLKDLLHSEGFCNQFINYDLINIAFEDLAEYIKTIEKT